MSPGPRVLVAGVGNIFLADDGFGVEVARVLAEQSWPEEISVADFGIRGVHLAYELLNGYDALVLVDTLSRGQEPGTITLFEPDLSGTVANGEGTLKAMDAHGMDPAAVLAMVADMGGAVGRVLVVGCEPAELGERMGLSPPVEAAVPEAVRAVNELLDDLISEMSLPVGAVGKVEKE